MLKVSGQDASACIPTGIWQEYSGTGFGVFFNCGAKDAIIAAISSIIIVFLGGRLAETENNPLISNFIQSFIAEVFIILSGLLLDLQKRVKCLSGRCNVLLVSAQITRMNQTTASPVACF